MNNPTVILVTRIAAAAVAVIILIGVVARYSQVLVDVCSIVIAIALLGWAKRGPRPS